MRHILWVELGVVTAMSELVLASALGHGMTFGKAFPAILIGSTLLRVAGILIGQAGAREGLPRGCWPDGAASATMVRALLA